MAVKFQIQPSSILVVVTLSIVLVSSDPSSSQSQGVDKNVSSVLEGLNLPLSFEFAGSSDNKFYFADIGQNGNWFEAKAYCEAYNLSLASVTTMGEHEALSEGLMKPPLDYNYYWTSASERRDLSLLKWGAGEGAELDASLINYWFPSQKGRYCGLLHLMLSDSEAFGLRLFGVACDYHGRTLCEMQL